MALRDYQIAICDSIVNKEDWGGSNVVVKTIDDVTKVSFYGNVIGIVDHKNKSVKCDNCGYNNACTSARINAVKLAANKLGYNVKQ